MAWVSLGGLIPVAAAWAWVFRRSGRAFWTAMAAAVAVLGVCAVAVRGAGRWLWRLQPVMLPEALAAAALLYALFVLADRLATRVLPGVARSGDGVYRMTSGLPPAAMAALLLLIVAPGEELFWRGLVQWSLGGLLPLWLAVAAGAACYGAVHLAARNAALVLAALLCGMVWGALYAWTGSMLAVVLCHGVWDCLTLLWLPLRAAGAGRVPAEGEVA